MQAAAPVKRGDKAKLGPDDYAGIVWNESRSLTGPQSHQARVQIAHTVMNGDEAWGDRRNSIAGTSTNIAKVPNVRTEQDAYADAKAAVAEAMASRARGIDPTDGSVLYQFLPGPSLEDFYERKVKTKSGPLNNSYPHGKLGSNNVYLYTYR
jgi:hypothetical protein